MIGLHYLIKLHPAFLIRPLLSTFFALLVSYSVADETKPKIPELDFSQVEIATLAVTEKIYMLTGKGGNIGILVGNDGIFLIDDQFAPLTIKIKEAISLISKQPIRFLLNTHWHFDHTGGNENFGKSDVLIVAHDNVRKRLSRDQFVEALDKRFPAQSNAALPVVTFNETLTFHFNDEEIAIFHVPPAHTDGDSVVHFKKANVIHAGDLFFNGFYPFIDGSTGGSIDGMLAGINRILARTDINTKIIPGHGPLGDQTSLEESRDMLVIVRDRTKAAITNGKSLEEIVSAKLLNDLDEKWGNGFLNSEKFLGIVYTILTKKE